MSTTAWTTVDEGFLRAYQWAAALAAGTPLPQESSPVPLGPGEVAHARLSPVGLAGYFGENRGYRPGFLLFGGPVGLAITGAASIARNQTKKAEAERAAKPKWHDMGTVELVVSSQRLVVAAQGKLESLWYAETPPPQWGPPLGMTPTLHLQPNGLPLLRMASPWAPLAYVFVHHLVEGRPPGVPLPDGLLDRAAAEGRLAR
jgi:hypothetical protein